MLPKKLAIGPICSPYYGEAINKGPLIVKSCNENETADFYFNGSDCLSRIECFGNAEGSIVLWSLFLAPLLITVLICMLYLEAIKKPSMAKPLMKWGHYGVTGAAVFVDILTGYKAVTDYAEYRMEDMIFKAAVSVLAVVKTGGALAYYVSRMLANIRRNVRI